MSMRHVSYYVAIVMGDITIILRLFVHCCVKVVGNSIWLEIMPSFPAAKGYVY